MNQPLTPIIKKSFIWILISIFIILLILGVISSGFAAYYTGKLDLINSMGTLLLALATLYIVYEMKKAREQNIEPTLFILAPVYKRYEFRWIPLEDLSPIVRPELKQDEKNRYESKLPIFRLKNIGSGPAKDIELTWSVKYELDDLLINPMINQYKPRIEDGFFSLHIAGKSMKQPYSYLTQSHVDYCIASPSSDFVESIEIPFDIFKTYELSFLTLPRLDKIKTFSGPGIHLLISYLDLHNKKYEKELVIKSEFIYLPNEVSSQPNSVKTELSNADNLQGFITFHVKELRTQK